MKSKRKLTPNQLFDMMVNIELDTEKREKNGTPFKLTRKGIINDVKQMRANGLI